jgi:hypothetical protein
MAMSEHAPLRRAGFWRRFLAFLADMAVVLVPLQIVVALLFAQTNGFVQGGFGFSSSSCVALTQLPEGLQTQIVNPTEATDCTKSLFGFPTSRMLTVARSKTEGGFTSTVSESFWLDSNGQLADRAGHDVTWIAMLVFVAYGVGSEVRWGRSLGDRLTRVRVTDPKQPSTQGLSLVKTVGRRCAWLIGLIPVAIAHAPILYYRNDIALMTQYAESSTYRVGFYIGVAAFLGWLLWIIVAISLKRDPIYDRLAKTAVIRI